MTRIYNIAEKFNKKRVFILHKSELEKRLDPFYYVPDIVSLEKNVLSKNPKNLREFVKYIASGATPKTSESDKYYTEKENGIPFLRVQNLSPTGELQFEDCKYINKETHEGMLKRSRVQAGDLLVKITGVGRMAVASVVPEEFEGNINQHVCVIHTGNKEISEFLAAYLNSDIGEKLASRRSTGGTRPALDYPALLSIPVLENKQILEISRKYVLEKKQYESEAEKLLESIDDYLLKELGIVLPEQPENTLVNRMFTVFYKKLSGQRFDPFYHQLKYRNIKSAILKSLHNVLIFKTLIKYLANGIEIRNYVEGDGVRYLRVSDLGKYGINDQYIRFVQKQEIPERIRLNQNCILISRSGSLGLINVVEPKIMNCILSSHIFKVELNTDKIDPLYLESYLRSILGQSEIFRNNNGGVIPEINQNALSSIQIVLPPLKKQQEIARNISEIREEAKLMKEKAKTSMEQAGKEIEEILLKKT